MAIVPSNQFQYLNVANVTAGTGASARLASLCQRVGMGKSLLLITDTGLYQLGLHKQVVNSLREQGVEVSVFHDVSADPSEAVVDLAVEKAKSITASGVIGFGGGSSMDVAKMVALLAHPDGEDTLPLAYGVDNVKGNRLPLIQVPTTAGTGSEVTPVAIITTGDTTKNACVSSVLMADAVVLDPELIKSVPPAIAAATGVDAMVHAIEAYTSVIKKNPMSDFAAKQALALLNGNIRAVCSERHSDTQRLHMLMGAMLAGQAFANAPVGAVHALAYPLGGHFHVSHGNSNALVLVAVMKFNVECAVTEYAELADWCLGPELSLNCEENAERFIHYLDNLLNELAIPRQLSDYGISRKDLPQLARDAMAQTRLLQNNPREMSERQALAIYESIL